MIAKVVVGAIAAISVTVTGVYFAMPDYSTPCCSGKNNSAVVSTDTSGCCSMAPASSCCGDSPEAMPTDALAACTGSMSFATTECANGTCPLTGEQALPIITNE